MVATDAAGESAIEGTLGGGGGRDAVFASTFAGRPADATPTPAACGDTSGATTVGGIAGTVGAEAFALAGVIDAVSEEQAANNAVTAINDKTRRWSDDFLNMDWKGILGAVHDDTK